MLKINRMTKLKVVKAWKKSESPIRSFLFHLSAKTPARGPRINWGMKEKKYATEIMVGFCVSTVIHHTITNWTTEEPNNENNCPIQKKI
jgi:hypothetical protein